MYNSDMDNFHIIFRVHAIQRMFQRQIDVDAVKNVLKSGEVIESYPEDTPYPSNLILGWQGNRPLHIVIAVNSADNQIIVITVYEPDSNLWKPDFKRRKS